MTPLFSSRSARTIGTIALFLFMASPAVLAQEVALNTDASASSVVVAALPDAPLPRPSEGGSYLQINASGPEAKITAKYIPAGWRAQPLDRRQKLNVALRDLYTPQSLAGYVLAGGYSHLTDGQPNYGTNSAAFGKRVGAAFARDTSQAIFTDAIFAPLLHEDPRYYVQGPSYSLAHRAIYAVTRPLITRNDDGKSTVNGSLLLGYAGAAALTSAYYPQSNRNAHDIASTYGSSIGGAALGFVFEEFTNDILVAVHLRHSADHR
jgi:hypothetical protein